MAAHESQTTSEVERIEVSSNWVGYARPPRQSARLLIARTGRGGFSRTVEPAGPTDEVPAPLVGDLVAALSRPPVKALDPALFPGVPEPVIRSHYDAMWTDDHPEVLVRVTFAGGRVASVHATAQQAYMLPLKVTAQGTGTGAGRRFKTFDPTLSRVVAALLPGEFLNKERLAGNEGMLRYELDQYARQATGVSSAGLEAIDAETERILNYKHPDPFSEPLLRKETTLDEFRRLLAAGANPNVTDDVHQTALMHAAFPPPDAERFRLLVEAGADVEARRDGATGLQLAAHGGDGETTALWLGAGADLHARTPDGATALMLGARWPDVVEVLLKAGADVNAVNDDGDSAIVYGIKAQCGVWPHPQLRAMRALIDAGADLGRRDREGVTPLGHARRKLAEERMARDVRRALGAAQEPQAGPPDAAAEEIPEEFEHALGWTDLKMAAEVVKLIEGAGGVE